MVVFYEVLGQRPASGTVRKQLLALEPGHMRMCLNSCFQLTENAVKAGRRFFLVRSIDGCQGFNLPYRPRQLPKYRSRTKLSKNFELKEESGNRVNPKSM